MNDVECSRLFIGICSYCTKSTNPVFVPDYPSLRHSQSISRTHSRNVIFIIQTNFDYDNKSKIHENFECRHYFQKPTSRILTEFCKNSIEILYWVIPNGFRFHLNLSQKWPAYCVARTNTVLLNAQNADENLLWKENSCCNAEIRRQMDDCNRAQFCWLFYWELCIAEFWNSACWEFCQPSPVCHLFVRQGHLEFTASFPLTQISDLDSSLRKTKWVFPLVFCALFNVWKNKVERS